MPRQPNRYVRIIQQIFSDRFKNGIREIPFDRSDLVETATQLGIKNPDNLGDILYTFRYRSDFPKSITDTAPEGEEWVIRGVAKGRYNLALTRSISFVPNKNLSETKILDSTPGIIATYTMTDEQALLAKVRFNRLIDIFTGLTCYPLQSHLRTTILGGVQVETDELYVGVNSRGAHFILPVQAKGGKDRLGIVQIEQDFQIAKEKFSNLIPKPIAAQFMQNDVIVLFEMEMTAKGLAIAEEKHYRLVAPDELSVDEIELYNTR